MKYVALLRGINVGGNAIIKMAALKGAFEKYGFQNVSSYIQSGNIIFESDGKSSKEIAEKLETSLSKDFNIDLRVVLISLPQMKKVLKEVPANWLKNKDLRCYIAFTRPPLKPKEILDVIQLKEGIDSAEAGQDVLYMTTVLSGITKSGFTKLISTYVYKNMTMRNYNTTKKILEIMER